MANTKKKAPRKKTAAKEPATNIVTTLKDVSKHFGVSWETVRKNWKFGGMPVEADGTYDLVKIKKWRDLKNANQTRMNGNDKEAESSDGLENNPAYQRKKVELKVKQEELIKRKRENEVAAGDYVPRHDVQMFFSALLARLRDDMARIPSEMASSFPSKVRSELEDQLKARLELCLETIYRQRNKIGDIEKKS